MCPSAEPTKPCWRSTKWSVPAERPWCPNSANACSRLQARPPSPLWSSLEKAKPRSDLMPNAPSVPARQQTTTDRRQKALPFRHERNRKRLRLLELPFARSNDCAAHAAFRYCAVGSLCSSRAAQQRASNQRRGDHPDPVAHGATVVASAGGLSGRPICPRLPSARRRRRPNLPVLRFLTWAAIFIGLRSAFRRASLSAHTSSCSQ